MIQSYNLQLALTTGMMLERARQDKGVDLNTLADKIGLSKKHIKSVEDGSSNPSLDFLRKYADAIGLQLMIVLIEDENKPE